MKAELLNQKFTPVEIKLTIETQREFEAMEILFRYTSANQRAEFINNSLYDSGTKKFDGAEVLFMEVITKCL